MSRLLRPYGLALLAMLLTLSAAHPAPAAPLTPKASPLGPVISAGFSPTSLPVTGGNITITATVTDPGGQAITGVTAFPSSGGEVSLSNGGSGNVYTGNFQVGKNTGIAPITYTASVTATDASNLSNTASTSPIMQANDDTPPTITAVSYSPSVLPVAGGTITVTATVTDPNGRAITGVTAFPSSGGEVSLSNGGSGNVYTGNFQVGKNTGIAPATYTGTVSASNDLGLSNSASIKQTIQANDDTPPTITGATLSPANPPLTGGNIIVTATVTDPNGRAITGVTAYPSSGGEVSLSNGGNGNIYTGAFQEGSSNTPYTLTGTVSASNDLGLTNTATLNAAQGTGGGGGTTSPLPVLSTLDPASPVLSPAFAAAGSAGVSLTITGSGFVSGATVLFNGVSLTPVSVAPTQVEVVVPAALVVNPGAYAVTVANAATTGLSNSVNFNVLTAEDVTALTQVAFRGQRLDRRTGHLLCVYSVTNTGKKPIPGGVSLTTDGLANARIVNASGVTHYRLPAGSPYVTVASAGLAPGASALVTLEIAKTGPGALSYTSRVLAGLGAR